MKILVAGSSGLVGTALVPFLEGQGHEVYRLVRKPQPNAQHTIVWNPKSPIEPNVFEGFDAIVNLAGENISSGRWTTAKKQAIHNSRVDTTTWICNNLAKLQNPPKVLVNASAIGYYGSQGDKILDENSSKGTGFLADVCQEWENSTRAAVEKGIRVVLLRFGVVLSGIGGALKQMLTPFKIGVGGVIGSGEQYMSWITLDDVVGIIGYAISSKELSGPVNAVSPDPVTNYEFTKTMGRVLHRPTIFPMPAAIARIVFGEMADELLLSSARVVPDKLKRGGYQYRYSALEDALRGLLDR